MKPLFLTLAAGVLLAFSLPPFNVEWLGWLALAPLFVAASGRRALEAMGLGMMAGVLGGVIHVGWQPDAHGVQFAYLPFRAVENRVPFVRADANGLSQIVDATGRIIGEAPLFVANTLVGDVALGDGQGTAFTRLGDWWPYLCLLVVAVFSLAAIRSPVAKKLTSSDAASSG